MTKFRLIKEATAGVGMNVYAISDFEQKVAAVTKLEAEVPRLESAEFQRLELPEMDSLEGSGKENGVIGVQP